MAERNDKYLREQFEKLTALVEKLLRETQGLARDISILKGRVEPFEGEAPPQGPDWDTSEMKTFVEAFRSIDIARKAIRRMEYDVNFIRGAMDTIVSDAVSREEMKPWLK